MKLAFNLSLYLIVFFSFTDESYSLTDYQIKKICKKAKRELTCRKNFHENRSKLQKGDSIEIPVIPYKRWLEFKFQILIQKD